jgi:hypothetical protein
VKNLALIALLCPAVAFASDCEHAQPRALDLDLDGVRTVRIEINSNELRLAPAAAGQASVTARACASDPDYFDQLRLTQAREGDVLVIHAERDGYSSGVFFRPTYAYLQLDAALPVELSYEVDVGSGDAWVSGLRDVGLEVGSGDAEVTGVSGTLRAKVGSGDITVMDAERVDVRSIGSGDMEIRGAASVRLGDLGSGDAQIGNVAGDVEVGSVGSGDLVVRDVQGSVSVRSLGSGDIGVRNVGGDLRVERVGSGEVDHRDVRGQVDIPTDE